MRGAVLWDVDDLRIEELRLDPPKAGEIAIRMAASGVCRSDYYAVHGIHPRRGRPVDDYLNEHLCGLFPRATWVGLIEEAGFDVKPVGLTHDERPVGAEGFLGIRSG